MSKLYSDSEIKEIKKQAVAEYLLEHSEILKNRWIPCSKELPKDITQDCLVTLKNGAVLQASYSYFGEEFRMICMHGIERFSDDNPVIAWQPTPEGYEESKEKMI